MNTAFLLMAQYDGLAVIPVEKVFLRALRAPLRYQLVFWKRKFRKTEADCWE